MSTLRKLVSDIRSMHKLLSSDNLITDRVIASEIKNNSLLLIKRETNLRKLWATGTLFTTIPCLRLLNYVISQLSFSNCISTDVDPVVAVHNSDVSFDLF